MIYDSDYEIRLATLEAMGGDMSNHYDSVYDIDLAILKLTEEGGGSANAIEEVDTLPDAEENKDSIYRLESNEKVYMSKYVPITPTNRLPDAQQIDKAYLYETSDDIYYYKGVGKLICTDGEIDGYIWQNTRYFAFTLDNAISASLDSVCYSIDKEYHTEWSIEGNIATTSDYNISDVQGAFDSLDGWSIQVVITATYNAPESAQIGNANLIDLNDYNAVYDGTQVTFIDESEVERIGYKWIVDGESDIIVSSKPASEIYFAKVDNGDDTYTYYTDVEFGIIWADDDSYKKTGIAGYENGLYIPQLNSPDSEQVDNAHIDDDGTIPIPCFYTGINASLTASNGVFSVYVWYNSDEDWFILTNTNGENTFLNTLMYTPEDSGDIIKIDDTHYEVKANNTLEPASYITLRENNYTPVTVKYQRTHEWEWKKVITEDELTSLEARIYALEHPNS